MVKSGGELFFVLFDQLLAAEYSVFYVGVANIHANYHFEPLLCVLIMFKVCRLYYISYIFYLKAVLKLLCLQCKGQANK